MDEAAVRRHAEAHAAAIARGDFAVAAEHVAEELLPELPHRGLALSPSRHAAIAMGSSRATGRGWLA
jgi:hypothetical protein